MLCVVAIYVLKIMYCVWLCVVAICVLKILGGARTKGSCSVHQHKTETSVPQPDPMQKLSSVVIYTTYVINIQLQHDNCELYLLQKICIMGLVMGTNCIDIFIL